ncbi:OmpP1/FadL family transporter [Sulfurivirga caldicuralii]|uniref:OmpP1/FadL family transporter n=1 Tax=Sulfurivirga caldicuralii TaxID=364032 RepID=UPI0013564843|nr:outer membrane protein transport protein [Sulfurivirga caldicuralii]
MKKRVLAAAIGLSVSSATAMASGFQLWEESASGLGRAFAGMGAATDDASVQWYNPAGMTAIDGYQIVVGGHYIVPSADFDNNGSTGIFASGKDDNGGNSAFIPNLFWKGQWQGYDLGLSVVTPFGLGTKYDSDWRGRYLGVESDLRTININPSIARKMGDWSFGVGISAQYMEAKLTKRILPSAVLQGLGYPALTANAVGDGTSELKGDSWAWGYNLGLTYTPTEKDRIGVSYRSQVEQVLSGKAKKYAQNGTYLGADNAKAELDLPAMVDISWSHRYNNALEVLLSGTWTGWSSFKELRVTKKSDGSTLSYTPERWHDTWRWALGANYTLNSKWLLRGGVAYDQTPVRDPYRTVRIPDNDRKWLSLGARYTIKPNLMVDMSYAHLWADKTKIDETVYAGENDIGAYTGHLKGSYDNGVDIFSAQLVWNF